MRADLTPGEISVRAFRIKLFTTDHCWPEDRAEEWADRLVMRDRGGDDRRICVECANLLSQWRCSKRGAVLADIPQRCPTFEWATHENREWPEWQPKK